MVEATKNKKNTQIVYYTTEWNQSKHFVTLRHWFHVENKCLCDKNIFISIRRKSMDVTTFKPLITCKMMIHEIGFIIIR
jgi:hypothetical protein